MKNEIKDQRAREYNRTEFANARFILPDTNLMINLGEYSAMRWCFGERMKELLEENDQYLLFCRSCQLELQKHARSDDPETARQADCGLRFVIDLYSQGRLFFYEDGGSIDRIRDEDFADPFTKDAALALFEHGNVLVITNDDDLAWDLLSQRSVKSRYYLHVAAVSPYGWLQKPKAFYELQEYKKWREEQKKHRENNSGNNGGELDEI